MEEVKISNVVKTLNDKKISFDFNNIDVAYVNALRRIILADIPTIGISFNPSRPDDSDVVFKKNTSALHNEYIGHRISLLPLYLSRDQIQSFDPNNFKCVIYKSNKTTKMVDVTTDDIKLVKQGMYVTNDIFPVDPITKDPILISKLRPNIQDVENGEEIDVEFTARRGTARSHARWCPVSICTYLNLLDDDLITQTSKTIDSKNKHVFDTLEKYRLFKKNEFGEANCFRFTVESECKLNAQEIIDMAFEVVDQKLASFDDSKKYVVDKIDGGGNEQLYRITINDEDHTLGNILQSYIYNKHVRESKDIIYVGYYQPHPLENQIVVKLKAQSDKQFNCKDFFNKCIKGLIENFNELRNTVNTEIM